MPNLTSVGLTAGLGTSGTGTISTLDNLIGTAGTASAQVLSVQGIASGTAQTTNLTQINGTTCPVGSGVQATAQRVTLATDSPGVTTLGRAAIANSLPVALSTCNTGTPTSVAAVTTAGGATVLASNSNRLGGSVFNDSTAILYLLLANGGTATVTTSVYTVQLGPNAYYEIPFNYTGALQGIWSAANGNARVTEYTT